MNDAVSITTWDLLRDFGFQPDAGVMSDPMPGLTIDFGNLKLSASRGFNLRFVSVVSFFGVLATPRRIAEIEFEMPLHVTSSKQCAAWIVWHLDQATAAVFTPTRSVEWLVEGRSHRSLLPWVSDLVAYRARPQCVVDREWMRLALKALREMLAQAADEEAVVFSFDGAVLTIQCGGKVVPLMAEGEPWPVRYAVAAGKLRQLPKRLMNTRIGVSVWDSKLGIGGWIYPCIEGPQRG